MCSESHWRKNEDREEGRSVLVMGRYPFVFLPVGGWLRSPFLLVVRDPNSLLSLFLPGHKDGTVASFILHRVTTGIKVGHLIVGVEDPLRSLPLLSPLYRNSRQGYGSLSFLLEEGLSSWVIYVRQKYIRDRVCCKFIPSSFQST